MSTNGSNGASARGAAASNGHKPGKKIRVAIVGVGNCASSLVQGRYTTRTPSPRTPSRA